MSHDLVITGGTVVTPEHGTFEADVAATDGVVSAVARPGSLNADREIDATGNYVLPGAIDPHTHHGIYRTLAEDAESESRSDLVGGVTTIGNYFRRPGSYAEIMDDYFAQAEPNYYHDYFFSLGLLSFEHVEEIPHIVEDLGITSFKWYMNYKYAAEEKFGVDCQMLDDFGDTFVRSLAKQDVPTTLGYHSENVEITNSLGDNPYLEVERDEDQEYRDYDALVKQFPDYAEAQSMIAGAALARQHGYGENFYAVHVSSGRTADELATLKAAGWGLTGETCTHYLTLTSEEADERHNVNPPVRSATDRETLWRRVADGTISCIGTDHCCNMADEKIGDDVPDSLPGFPSTATMLPLVLSEGVDRGRISLERAVEVTSTNTAKAFDLYPKKGTVRVGSDADLVVVDLKETKTVTPELLKSAADYSPYDGREVTGWPTHTVVKGQVAYERGEVVGDPGHGTHIDRPI
ncbi:dihydroorotase [Halomarina ordinaria]|uniref:Dihydroorotase family protein n=1 Tax=Halomarina ordinaria TaxID=3033939 RepID=A0ABD5UBG1_9EURY|nr:amidohydrolase family protein [Halomarina sp. PSRA2]